MILLDPNRPSLPCLKSSKIAEMAFNAGDFAVSGSKTVQVDVKK